jgi:hypothetical protein
MNFNNGHFLLLTRGEGEDYQLETSVTTGKLYINNRAGEGTGTTKNNSKVHKGCAQKNSLLLL